MIIGGGPVGSYAALNLLKQASKPRFLKNTPKLGFPSHCAGHLSIRSLNSMGLYPLPNGIVENTFRQPTFTRLRAQNFHFILSQPVTCALNRARFDQYLLSKREAAGARFQHGHPCPIAHHQRRLVKGVNILTATADRKSRLPAKITVMPRAFLRGF